MKSLYVIYDSKMEHYTDPTYFRNDDVALRSLVDLLSEGDSQYARHPEDFALFRIGNYNPDTAQVDPLGTHVCVARRHEITVRDANNLPTQEQLEQMETLREVNS